MFLRKRERKHKAVPLWRKLGHEVRVGRLGRGLGEEGTCVGNKVGALEGEEEVVAVRVVEAVSHGSLEEEEECMECMDGV